MATTTSSAALSFEEAAPSVGPQSNVALSPSAARAKAERWFETKARLREAAVRLQPRNWLKPSTEKHSDAAYDDVRSRYQHWLEHAPFNTAYPASWRYLIDLAISYSSYTFRPEGGVRPAESDALVSWFTCFWKLDNLVDDCLDRLPENYLERLRQVMAQAWFGDENQLDNVLREHSDDLVAFHDQAVALLIDHRRQLRVLGHPIEKHPEYREAVWKHIVCQTEAAPKVGSLMEYVEMRRVRGGMECVFQMFLALQGVEWDDSFAPIVEIANIVTCLTDDLFSCVKDAKDGVVSALSVSGPNGLERVLALVCGLHQGLLEMLERRLAADPSESTHLLVRTVLDVVLGMIEWQAASPRYREGAQKLAELMQVE